MEQACDVAIVGAGLAGLVAARKLRAAGKRVLVLEAQDRVGGRTLDYPLAKGKTLSLGGQWLGPGQTHIRALCDELGIETYPSYNGGDHLSCFGGKRLRVSAQICAAASLPCQAQEEIQALSGRLEQMFQEVPLGAPYLHPQARSWDEQSLEDWLQSQTPDTAVHRYFQLETKGIFAAEASDISLLHVLFYLKSGGGLASLISTENGAQQDCIVGGAQQIAQKIAAGLGDACLLSTPVRRLEQHQTGVRVVADTLSVTAARVIVAAPPAVAKHLVYEPALPSARAQLQEQLRVGSVIKVVLVYGEPFWRRSGLSGQVFSSRGPLHTTYDASPPDGKPGVLVGFLEGRDSVRLAKLRPRERARVVTENLAAYFGPEAKNYLQYLDKAWSQDAWAGGGYSAYFGPGQWTSFGSSLRAPVGRIHWAGSETASIWNGYMEGAVRSGERAVHEVSGAAENAAPCTPLGAEPPGHASQTAHASSAEGLTL